MIRGVVSDTDPSAFTSCARVETVKVCAESAFAPPVVPVPEDAQPSFAPSVWWNRSTASAFAFITRKEAPRPAAATAAAETTRVRRLRRDRRWEGVATKGGPYGKVERTVTPSVAADPPRVAARDHISPTPVHSCVSNGIQHE